MRFTDSLRQLRFPPEFRIAPPAEGEDTAALLERVAKLLAQEAASPKRPRVDPEAESQRARFLADLATGMWRLRNKLVDPATGKPVEEVRRAYRHFEAVWDLLAKARVQVYDHTGEDFDPGQTLKALAFEPRSGLRKPRVLETIKPTVYVGDDLVQIGEVFVGTPEQGSEQL